MFRACGPTKEFLDKKWVLADAVRSARIQTGSLIGATRPFEQGRSVARLVFDRSVDLPLYSIQIERGRILHRGIVDRRESKLGDFLLNADEPPELARKEVVHVASTLIIEALLTNRWCPLERILTDVDHGGHVSRYLAAGPALRLLEELELEVIEANCPVAGPPK